MPLEMYGSFMDGIRIEFEGGRAVRADADVGADALRAAIAKDDGASRLGELALVDREGRIGPLDTVFYDTLLDENAASHVALGNAYTFPVEDEADRERDQRQRHPRRLHDRQQRDRRRRHHPRRRPRAGAPRRLLADLVAVLPTRHDCTAARGSPPVRPRSSSRGSAARLSRPKTRSKSGVVR